MNASATSPSKIGPNSIIQTVNALEASIGKEETEALLNRIGQGHFIGNLPTDMTDESIFHSLVTTLDAEIGAGKTASILEESGQRTAEYLLRVRIPGLFPEKSSSFFQQDPLSASSFLPSAKTPGPLPEAVNSPIPQERTPS